VIRRRTLLVPIARRIGWANGAALVGLTDPTLK